MAPLSSNPPPLIIGCGFLGGYLAKLLLEQQQPPMCIVRSQSSHEALVAQQLHSLVYDLDQVSDDQPKLALTDRQIYYLAPPSQLNKEDSRMDRFLDLCRTGPPSRIVYISTSGVYGDCQGQWVSEESPVVPISDRAKRRVYAENAIKTFCAQSPCEYIILRVGGIYGPGRLPIDRLDKITVICPEEAPYSNRIHVADLAAVCYAAMKSPITNEIINVSDGHATSMSDYYFKIADFAGLPRPDCVPLHQAGEKLSHAMLSFVNESRRLSIEKMNSLLEVKIQFPTLEDGLNDCFKNSA